MEISLSEVRSLALGSSMRSNNCLRCLISEKRHHSVDFKRVLWQKAWYLPRDLGYIAHLRRCPSSSCRAWALDFYVLNFAESECVQP
jgi:hypothetical protein